MDIQLSCVISLCLTLVAWRLHAVTVSGALVGMSMAIAFSFAPTPHLFGLFVLFVIVGSAVSRLGKAEKVRRGIAQSLGGRRSGWHAVANGGPSLLFLMIGIYLLPAHLDLCLVAAAASLTAMLSDTVAGEVGAWCGGQPKMILTMRPAKPGDDGAVTVVGTMSGLIAAGLGAWVVGMGTPNSLQNGVIVASAAIFGNLADSVLGQVVEPRLGRNGGFIVNAAASIIGGLAAIVLLQMW